MRRSVRQADRAPQSGVRSLTASPITLHKFTRCFMMEQPGYAGCVTQLMEAGAAGFLIKQTAANDLLKAIREVQRGNAFFSPAIAKRLRDHCREAFTTGQSPKKANELTSREAEVLQLIAEGKSTKDIATLLGISVKTADSHRSRLMRKLDIHEVATLVRYAIRKGVVQA